MRFEILRRDGFRCKYCGAQAPDVALTVDHVIPTALGGADTADNLVTACSDCNAGKASSNPDEPVVDSVAADAERWRYAMETAAAKQLADRGAMYEYLISFERCWRSWHVVDTGDEIELPNDWKQSVARFYSLGLEIEYVIEAVETAMTARSRDPFKYFCGVCWNILRERQDLARAHFADRS